MTESTADLCHKYPGLSAQVLEFGSGPCQLNDPWFIDVDDCGDLSVADTYNHRVQIINTTAYEATCSIEGGFHRPRSAKFTRTAGLGFLIVADTGNRRVLILSRPSEAESAQIDCEFKGDHLREPTDTLIDHLTGHIYVTDTSNNAVFMIGERVTPFQYLNQPMGIAMDDKGRMFVTETGDACVKVFDRSGVQIGRLDGGPCHLNRPKGICIDRRGFVCVADELNDRIVKFSPDLRMTSVVVRELSRPKGVAVNRENQLFATSADRSNVIKLFNI
ncbi:uncharacterized protein LOC141905726 [Tubulanus polymorphus]|uniref:uncharacterized protein LOC141905726 n=1 Tax=Tubulanus polymorphus TaxID=672921 RepID=UPI003DA38537